MLKSTWNSDSLRPRSGRFLTKIAGSCCTFLAQTGSCIPAVMNPVPGVASCVYNTQHKICRKIKQTEKYIFCRINRWRSWFFWSPSSTIRFIRRVTNLNEQSPRRVKNRSMSSTASSDIRTRFFLALIKKRYSYRVTSLSYFQFV
jgi:hypothetical protein